MIKRKDDIKASFATNSVPTQADFADLIDSAINQADDGLKKSPGDPLTIIAGGDTQEVFSFYKSFGAKKPAWNTNLNPAGDNPGLNFYTQNGSSRLFISEDTGNVGIGNTSLKKVPGLTGPFLQIGSDAEGSGSGQLILSKHMDGATRSFKMGVDENNSFSLGDFGNNGDLVYTPALTIDWRKKNVTIPQSLNVVDTASASRINIGHTDPAVAIALAGAVLQIGTDAPGDSAGQLIISKSSNKGNRSFKMGIDDDFNFSLGDYGAFNSDRKYTPALTIDWEKKNVAIPQSLNVGNRVSSPRINIGIADPANEIAMAGPVLQIGTDAEGVNAGQLLISKRTSDGRNRSFKMGLDDNFAFSLGDYENFQPGRKYTPALTIDWDKKNVTIPQSLFVGGGISAAGITLNENGAILLRGTDKATDLGLYSTVEKKWIRIVANQAPIVFFNNKEGDNVYGSASMSMLIDSNRNVGIGTNSILNVGIGPVLQIGRDTGEASNGALVISKRGSDGGNRSFRMSVNDKYNLSIGDYGYDGQPSRAYSSGLIIQCNDQKVNIPKALILASDSDDNQVNYAKLDIKNGGLRVGKEASGDFYKQGAGGYMSWNRINKETSFVNNGNGKETAFVFDGSDGNNINNRLVTMRTDGRVAIGMPGLGLGTTESTDPPYVARLTVNGGLHCNGDPAFNSFNKMQGAYLTWNLSASNGETNIVNNIGGGPSWGGGFQFIEVLKNGTASTLGHLKADKLDLTTSRGLRAGRGEFTELYINNQEVFPGRNGLSDERIKKDIKPSDLAKDLEILKLLKVKNYNLIDPNHGDENLQKGLIAQELVSIYPEAVTLNRGFLPDIMSGPQNITSDEDGVTVTMAAPHNLVSNDIVKFKTLAGDKQLPVTVLNETTFTIDDNPDDYAQDVMVYGKQVDDLRMVDYNRLFMLNLSATQQLAIENEQLKKRLDLYNKDIQNIIDWVFLIPGTGTRRIDRAK